MCWRALRNLHRNNYLFTHLFIVLNENYSGTKQLLKLDDVYRSRIVNKTNKSFLYFIKQRSILLLTKKHTVFPKSFY